MQLKPISTIAVLLLLIVSLSVTGCTASQTPSQNPTASAAPQVSTVSPTPVATVATPSVSGDEEVTNGLTVWTNMIIEKLDYSVTAPFKKTSLNGKEVYVGKFQKQGNPYEDHVYPMKSYADATNFKEILIPKYKNQGYVRYYPATEDSNIWYGTKGNTIVMISAVKTTFGFPATWVEISSITD